jgi:signal transduction histidine kinase
MLDSEALKLEPKEVVVMKMVKEAVSFLDAGQKLSVTWTAQIEHLPHVRVDGPMVTEVFRNLIENGLKFNDKAEKRVQLTADIDGAWVTIHVKDNGVGIPAEEIERIFQKFYQIENSFTGQVPGAGLGLSLCRKVVEGSGGKIAIQSELKKGTTVSVTLPCI